MSLDSSYCFFTTLRTPLLYTDEAHGVVVVILAENQMVKDSLNQTGADYQTIEEVQTDGRYILHNAAVLGQTLSHLGR